MQRQISRWQIGLALFCLFIFLILLLGVHFQLHYIHLIDQLGLKLIREPVTSERTWFFKNITRAGNPIWTAFVAMWACFFAIILKKYDIAIFVVVNVGVFGLGVMKLLKHFVNRPRPSILHLVNEGGSSFPSGHAMNSMLLYGSLIVLVHYYIKNEPIKYAFMTLLTCLIVTIPMSRVYLGVHYLSDVLAGLSLACFLLIFSKEFIFKYKPKEI